MKKIILFLVCSVQVVFAQVKDYSIIKEVQVRDKGVVVSAHPLASEAGVSMLRKGGNAFDAVVATQLALAVVYPQAGNIGGGGFLVGAKADGNKFAFDFRETAPSRAGRDMYLKPNGDANLDLSQNDRLAVGVPGSVAGLFATLRHCKLSMKILIKPAIELASKGFAITQSEADLLNTLREEFRKYNKEPIAFVKAEKWKAGDILIQKDLAVTLKRIQSMGAKGFYDGKTAYLLVKEMQKGNGIITLEDLKGYSVKTRNPIVFPYKGHDIVTMPLPSSGGILLAQMLKMAAMGNIDQSDLNAPEAVQVMIEAERRAYADRAEYMGDPDFIDDQTAMLISEDYLKKRWVNFDESKASKSADVGKIINPHSKESTETTHISVLDKEGNAASLTTTLNGLYGSKVVVQGAGFFLNNEMDDFSVKPGVPNMFGAVGGEANAIFPNKRMLSSMTPTIVMKNGKPYMVVGTPGGTTIPTSVYQAIVDVLDFGQNANCAVNAPKFHHQWLPEVVYVESNFPKTTIKALENKGYVFEDRGEIGRTEIILVNKDQSISAVADGRGDDGVAIE